jgi:hypothetical protein
MTRRAARIALGFYPLAFRRRYGQEMQAVLEQAPPRASTVLDLVRGALVAHVRPPAAVAGFVQPADRVRASASGVLGCWVAFSAAGFAFYKTTENEPFTQAGYSHPFLGAAHSAVRSLAVLGSAAVVLGALPLIANALAAGRRERRLRRWISVPFVAVLLFTGVTAVLVAIAHGQHARRPGTLGGVAFIVWGVGGLACGAACVETARAVLFAVPMERWRLKAAFHGAAVTTAAMAAMTLATAVYAVALPIDAAHLAGTPNGPLQAVSASASVIVEAVVMTVAATLAATATRRGWRAADRLRGADAPRL